MADLSRRALLAAGLALPSWAVLAGPAAADQQPVLDDDFPGGCCVFEGLRDGVLVCRPRTPATVSGNLWYRFCGRLTGATGPTAIELHWPPTNVARSATAEYGGNENAATALDRTLNVSDDRRRWRHVDNVVVEGQVARFTVEPTAGQPLYLAVGIPYWAEDLEELLTECRASPLAQITEIARTTGGQPVHAIRIGPAGPGAGSFYLQGYQHHTEWAGARILSAMARDLLSEAGRPLRERYVFHLVPVMNVGAFHGAGAPGNMNRDWRDFKMPETRGARDYLRRELAGGERLLHALDLHMGWSKRRDSGACLTAGRPGTVPDAIIARQEAFAKHAYASCDWTMGHIWRPQHPTGRAFNVWVIEELGVAAQTAEFSRHIVWDRARGEWVRLTQEHEERLGRDLAEALGSFPWDG